MAFHFPPPAEWQTFQTLVAGFAESLFDADTVEEYGRTGQRQNGVDIFAKDRLGKNVGIQVKWTSDTLSEKALADECAKAVQFSPKLDLFILWTTAKRDVHLQDIAHDLDSSGQYDFSVSIRFWDDAILHLNRAYSVASAYYADWVESNHMTADHDHRKKLRVAFDRPAFLDPIHLERDFGDLLQAVKDTLVFLKAGLLYDRYNQTLVAQALPFSLLSDAAYVEGLAKVLSLLTQLQVLLERESSYFGAPVMTDERDVQECDRLRKTIVRRVRQLLR